MTALRGARHAAAFLGSLVAVSLWCLVTAAADVATSPVRWDRAAYDGGADLSAVAFSGSATGFAVGERGTILSSRDGGSTWTTASLEATADLHAVCVDPAGGFHAAGAHGTVVGSPDARSWTTTDTGSPADLNGIDFADPAHGCAVGGAGTVLATSDAGVTWRASAAGVDPSVTLLGIDLVDPYAGWAWGGSGAVYATRDGGATWAPTRVSPETTWCAGCFTSGSEGWIGGTGGLLAHTTDGGETWAFLSLPVTGTIVAIDFCDALHGVLLAAEGTTGTAVAATADGGETWEVSREAGALRSVAISDGLHGWAVGDAGVILRTTAADAPATVIGVAPFTPPRVTSARAMPDGTVLIGWSDVPGSSGYVVRRSVGGGPFDAFATRGPGEAPGIRDDSVSAGDVVAYSVSACFSGSESVPGPVAGALALPRPAGDVAGPAPSGMSCTDCHAVHTTTASGDPAAQRSWCLDCHPAVQRSLAGPDAATRHDLLAGDAGEAMLGLACTDCHSAHASSETTPLIDPDRPSVGLSVARNGFCIACHDGELTQHVREREQPLDMHTAPPADIAATWGSVEQTTSMDAHGYGVGNARLRPGSGLEAGDVMRCMDCHDAHGSTNRWSLRESIATDRSAVVYAGLLVEPLAGGGADLRLFCGACHLLDLHPQAGAGGADLAEWPIDCTECHRHGSGL